MTAIGIGIGLCFGSRRRSVLQRLLSLSPEALWMPGQGETLVSGRVSSAPDLSGHGHVLTQAVAGKQPLFVAGPPPLWRFDRARLDTLFRATGALALPVGGYTFFAVLTPATLSGPGEYQILCNNGNLAGADGHYIAHGDFGGTSKRSMFHTAVGMARTGDATLALQSWIMWYDGTNVMWRTSGVDDAPVAIAPPIAATQAVSLGSYNNFAHGYNGDIWLFGAFARSPSTADITALGAIFQQGWAIP